MIGDTATAPGLNRPSRQTKAQGRVQYAHLNRLTLPAMQCCPVSRTAHWLSRAGTSRDPRWSPCNLSSTDRGSTITFIRTGSATLRIHTHQREATGRVPSLPTFMCRMTRPEGARISPWLFRRGTRSGAMLSTAMSHMPMGSRFSPSKGTQYSGRILWTDEETTEQYMLVYR